MLAVKFSNQLEKLIGKTRRAARASMVKVANGLAYEAKTRAIHHIDRAMTLRSPTFISSTIRYSKATKETLRSEWGEVEKARFGGLVSEEFGGRQPARRTFSTASRGGSRSRRVQMRARLKPGVSFLSPASMRGDKPSRRLLARVHRTRYKKPFIIYDDSKIAAGLYQVTTDGSLVTLQRFGRSITPSVRRWMQPTNDSLRRTQEVSRRWRSDFSATLARYARS